LYGITDCILALIEIYDFKLKLILKIYPIQKMIIELPSQFGYVFLSILYSTFLNMYFYISVFKARLDLKVEYPNMYADPKFEGEANSKKFNCI